MRHAIQASKTCDSHARSSIVAQVRKFSTEQLSLELSSKTTFTVAAIMVEFVSHPASYGEASKIHRDYWKLASSNLLDLKKLATERGCPSDSVQVARLVELLSRPERGLICYEKCSHAELEAFCRARGLARVGEATHVLIAVLEHADKEATFDRFTDLPAELRVRIYSMHFQSFGSALETPVQPPITTTSKLLRKEALPLFYQSFAFVVSITDVWSQRDTPIFPGYSRFCDLEDKTKAFWAKLPQQYLTLINKICFNDFRDRGLGIEWLVDLGTNGHPSRVEHLCGKVESTYMAMIEEYTQRLRKVVDRMAVNGSGSKTLRRGDIQDFVNRWDEDMAGPEGEE